MLSAAALIIDLGRPERFVNMLRTIKLTSPMSLGSWILSAFSAGAGVAAAAEVDRMTGERIPLGPLRPVLRAVEGPAGLEAAAFAPPLGVYTAVLLADTATPTWNAAHKDLPFVFVSSASLAAAGLAMITTPVAEAGPARRLAVLGVVGRPGRDEGHGASDGSGRRRTAASRVGPAGCCSWSESLRRRRRGGHAVRRAPPRRSRWCRDWR